MAYVNVNGNSIWVDNPQYDSDGNVYDSGGQRVTGYTPINMEEYQDAAGKANDMGYASVVSAIAKGVNPTDLGLPSNTNLTNYNQATSGIEGIGKVNFDDSGNYIPEGFADPSISGAMPANYPGGFSQWVSDRYATGQAGVESGGLEGVAGYLRGHGYMVPLAAMAAFGGLAAAGAGAAEAGAGAAGAGAGSADAYMASAGLTPGTFEGAAFTMPSTLGSAGYTGMNDYMTQAGLDTGGAYTPTYSSMNDYMAQAGLDAGKFEGAGFQMPGTLSAKDALTYASRLKSLGSLLSGGGGGGGSGTTSQQQVANYLRDLSSPVQTNDYLGQIKMNQTPFFGGNQGTLSGENVYDVSGTSAMANALRKK